MTLEIRSRGTPAQQATYRASIQPLLHLIDCTKAGAIVLSMLRTSPRPVTIQPFGPADAELTGGTNAYALATNPYGSGTFGAGRPAGGSGSLVHFSVGMTGSCSPGGSQDEVLLHELCHSLRHVTGTARYMRDPDGREHSRTMVSFGTTEEFFANIVTGVHSSERGRRARGNHGLSGIPDPSVMNEAPYSTRLGEIARRMPEFHRRMAQIPSSVAAFNPFRDNVSVP